MVRNGAFRSDLYYRLNVVCLHVPPLRERRQDIIPLAEFFLLQEAQLYDELGKRLAPETRKCLLTYSWPGNVRELANAMQRAFALAPDRTIMSSELPQEVIAPTRGDSMAPFPTLEDAERDLLAKALRYTGGRRMAAAQLLGVERRRLNRLIRDLGIQPTRDTSE
jgi:DNA-binding NtrC family response regulator